VDEAADDRPGEGRGSKVARHVHQLLGQYDQLYNSLTLFHEARVDWIGAWPWTSSTVKASITRAGTQAVHEFNAMPEETDNRFAVRIAREIAQLRLKPPIKP
jgi:hypothetical protein